MTRHYCSHLIFDIYLISLARETKHLQIAIHHTKYQPPQKQLHHCIEQKASILAHRRVV
jgi:hypothetical protein